MIRHQIYLTPQLQREIEIKARVEGRSKSKIIRETLEEKFNISGRRKSGGEVLLEMAQNAYKGKVPKDLSTNLFDYLYGEKSPNYGIKKKKLLKKYAKKNSD